MIATNRITPRAAVDLDDHKMPASVAGRSLWSLFAATLSAVCLLSAGCIDFGAIKKAAEQSAREAAGEDDEVDDDFLSMDEDTTPEERTYLEQGKGFVVALAAGDYKHAYEQLSSHARTRMTLEQFVPAERDEENPDQKQESQAFENVTPEQFAELMKKAEDHFGKPASVSTLYVASSDPDELQGKSDRFSVMLAIGAMPSSVPLDIRKAALRGEIGVKLKPDELKKLADLQGTTVEELEENEDFEPYFNVKYVLVEEQGQLKVGYFEFIPASILD